MGTHQSATDALARAHDAAHGLSGARDSGAGDAFRHSSADGCDTTSAESNVPCGAGPAPPTVSDLLASSLHQYMSLFARAALAAGSCPAVASFRVRAGEERAVLHFDARDREIALVVERSGAVEHVYRHRLATGETYVRIDGTAVFGIICGPHGTLRAADGPAAAEPLAVVLADAPRLTTLSALVAGALARDAPLIVALRPTLAPLLVFEDALAIFGVRPRPEARTTEVVRLGEPVAPDTTRAAAAAAVDADSESADLQRTAPEDPTEETERGEIELSPPAEEPEPMCDETTEATMYTAWLDSPRAEPVVRDELAGTDACSPTPVTANDTLDGAAPMAETLVVEVSPGFARRRARRMALTAVAGLLLGAAPWIAATLVRSRDAERTSAAVPDESALLDASARLVAVAPYGSATVDVSSLLSDPEARRLGALFERAAAGEADAWRTVALEHARSRGAEIEEFDELAPDAYARVAMQIGLAELRDVRARIERGPGDTFCTTVVGRRLVKDLAGTVVSDAPFACAVHFVRVPVDVANPEGLAIVATVPLPLPSRAAPEVER